MVSKTYEGYGGGIMDKTLDERIKAMEDLYDKEITAIQGIYNLLSNFAGKDKDKK